MNEAELDDLLSAPRRETVAALAACPGDIVVLGAGGKMGPTLARMAARAAGTRSPRHRACRAGRPTAPRRALEQAGVETLSADLLDRDAVATLPDAPNVVFMAGQKFGTSGAPALTWAMNTIVPANCAERYRDSRIVAFSTGNVYPLTPTSSGGLTRDGLARSRRRVRRVVRRPRTRVRAVRRASWDDASRSSDSTMRSICATACSWTLRREVKRGELGVAGHGIRQRDLAGRRESNRARVSSHGGDAAVRRQRHRRRAVVGSRDRRMVWQAFRRRAKIFRQRTRPMRC